MPSSLHVFVYHCGCRLGQSPTWLAALEPSLGQHPRSAGTFLLPFPYRGQQRSPVLAIVIIRASGVKTEGDRGGPRGPVGTVWRPTCLVSL